MTTTTVGLLANAFQVPLWRDEHARIVSCSCRLTARNKRGSLGDPQSSVDIVDKLRSNHGVDDVDHAIVTHDVRLYDMRIVNMDVIVLDFDRDF